MKRGNDFKLSFPNTSCLSKSQRKRVKLQLKSAYGDTCYWCGGIMSFPVYGQSTPTTKETATIEHYLAKEKGDNIMYLRLAHMGCNL